MSTRKLESLRIQNFRTFKDLSIGRLGRVNLIVGKNNVGKTSLLEALHLYVRGGTGRLADDVLAQRDLPALDATRSTEESEFGVQLPAIRHLFYGRPDLSFLSSDDEVIDAPTISISSRPARNREMTIKLAFNNDKTSVYPQYTIGEKLGTSALTLGEKTVSVFVRSHDLRAEGDRYWDQITMTKDADLLVESLRIIDESVMDVSYRPDRTSNSNGRDTVRQIPLVRLKGLDRPEPMSNMGEGMNRLLALMTAMIRARDGVVLIDEIENGLHYSVHSKMWDLLFRTAQDLDLQVFATTHSHDCVESFDQVGRKYEEEEGMLIQLRRRRSEPEEIVAVTANEAELESALHTGIDPR
jgi:AAA15 family ATPase/GTPase